MGGRVDGGGRSRYSLGGRRYTDRRGMIVRRFGEDSIAPQQECRTD